MKLSCEIQVPDLKTFHSYMDYDFVLTHKVEDNEKYREFYKKSNNYKILDNCLDYYSRVTLESGDQAYLGPIVKKRQHVKVLSLNLETGKVEPQKVVGWFQELDKSARWLKVITDGAKRNRTGIVGTICTEDHKFYIPNRGWVRAKNLEVGDKLFDVEMLFTDVQLQLILGSSIGDSSIWRTRSDNIVVRVNHSDTQKKYFDLKYRVLQSYLREPYVGPNNKRGFNKRAHAKIYSAEIHPSKQLRSVHRLLYLDVKHKKLNLDYLNKLNEIGLAFWYMDDGSYSGNEVSPTCSIHLNKLSKKEKDAIMSYFKNKWNLEVVIKRYGKDTRVIFNTKACKRLFTLISQYVLESMQYKLSKDFRKKSFWNSFNYKDSGEPITVTIKDIQEVKRSSVKYNITVEKNHNFFANNVLVSNSSFELPEPVSVERLLSAAEEVHAEEVILPDVIGDTEASRKLLKESLKTIDSIKETWEYCPELVAVTHGETVEEFLEYFVELINNEDIYRVCIPFDLNFVKLASKTASWMYSRLLITQIIDQEGLYKEDKKVHLLGASNPIEMKYQSKYDWIESVDTSSPIQQAVLGVTYDPIRGVLEKKKALVDYDHKLTSDERERAFFNLGLFKGWCSG